MGRRIALTRAKFFEDTINSEIESASIPDSIQFDEVEHCGEFNSVVIRQNYHIHHFKADLYYRCALFNEEELTSFERRLFNLDEEIKEVAR